MSCGRCGAENPEGFRFCGSCGAPLETAGTPAREERKVVTVLFADLVGFTSRSEQLDPEDVRALLGGYHELLRAELERFGGTVEKFIGDAAMALFGAPTAHEDDPERAVRAALAIREAIGRLNEREGRGLRVRIGITTGEARSINFARRSAETTRCGRSSGSTPGSTRTRPWAGWTSAALLAMFSEKRRWVEPALLHLDGKPGEAAARLDEIGSLPDAARTRLEIGTAGPELDRAVSFYRSVGATFYLGRAERLLAASA